MLRTLKFFIFFLFCKKNCFSFFSLWKFLSNWFTFFNLYTKNIWEKKLIYKFFLFYSACSEYVFIVREYFINWQLWVSTKKWAKNFFCFFFFYFFSRSSDACLKIKKWGKKKTLRFIWEEANGSKFFLAKFSERENERMVAFWVEITHSTIKSIKVNKHCQKNIIKKIN